MDFVFLGATNFSKVCASIVIFVANTVMTRTWSEIVGKSFYLILSSYIFVSIANLYLSSAVTIVVRHFIYIFKATISYQFESFCHNTRNSSF